jgi:hypothetical protein
VIVEKPTDRPIYLCSTRNFKKNFEVDTASPGKEVSRTRPPDFPTMSGDEPEGTVLNAPPKEACIPMAAATPLR